MQCISLCIQSSISSLHFRCSQILFSNFFLSFLHWQALVHKQNGVDEKKDEKTEPVKQWRKEDIVWQLQLPVNRITILLSIVEISQVNKVFVISIIFAIVVALQKKKSLSFRFVSFCLLFCCPKALPSKTDFIYFDFQLKISR